jgi:hypothetical protein
MVQRETGLFLKTKSRMPDRKRIFVGTTLALIFATSVMVRLPLLNKPLCRPREWLNATVLRHLQIWHEVGIAHAHFAPIMTYPGRANKNISNAASEHMDSQGNYYYTSYPPLAYYVPYFIFEALHIYPSILPLQIFNLSLDLICGILIYRALTLLLDGENDVCIPALLGFAVYIFSPQTLWLQSNVYMSDIFVQVLFIAGICFVLKWAKYGPSSGISSYLNLGVLTFCFVYAEWLGIMFALSLLLYARLNRDQPWVKGFCVAVILGTCAAIGLIIWQYSLISGLHAFLVSSHHRYLLRSGLGQQGESDFHPWSLLGWLLILTYLVVAYAADFLLLVLWAAIGKKYPAPEIGKNMKAAVVCSAVLPPILHHLAFFNFTAYHEFSTLKDAPMIALLAGVLALRLWKNQSTPSSSVRSPRTLLIGSMLLFCAIAIPEYRVLTGPMVPAYKVIGECITRNSTPDEVVFAQYQQPWAIPLPQVVLYAHRNIAIWLDEVTARQLAQKNGVSKGVLFVINSAQTDVTEIRHIQF